MSFGRQKRLLVGALALLAPLPLPFSDVIGWPVLLIYALGVALFLRRAWQDRPRWLPLWALNLLGLAYLPILGFDMFVLHRGHLVAPVLHLGLFALLVKLCAMRREGDKWQLVIGIFFIFLAAMGTSTHPTIALYLAAFLALSLVVLLRFAFFHVLADFSRDEATLPRLPLRGLVIGGTLAVLLMAVPMFALLPRLRTPYIVGRGGGSGGIVQEAAGFSDAVTLEAIDQIRTSRAVAIRVQFEDGAVPPDLGQNLRFKAATYDAYEGGHWRHAPRRRQLQRRAADLFVLAPGRPSSWLHVWLQPLRSPSLPLPVEALQVVPNVAGLQMDDGGALALPFSPLEVRQYRVGMGTQPVLLGVPPAGPDDPSLDSAGVTPRITALAARVAGQGSSAQRAARLEGYLSSAYSYTLDLGGRSPDEDPIESFLFRYKSGQCEYFASAMVLMLRSQGIPARLVTGFLGGEYNRFEGYLVLRDSNAHAWVEAYLGDGARDAAGHAAAGGGWHLFDPTPPAGRPAENGAGLGQWLTQAWDFVQFRWDRYVLTYGVTDQVALWAQMRRLWDGWMQIFERPHAGAAGSDPAAAAAAAAPGAVAGAADESPRAAWLRRLRFLRSPWTGLLLLLLAAALWAAWRRWHVPLDATRAYGRIRRRLIRAGLRLSPAVPPLALQAQAARRFPAAGAPLARIVELYLGESFGGRRLAAGDLAQLRAALAAAESLVR